MQIKTIKGSYNGLKINLFDIDGTIYDHDKNIPESTRKTVAELRRQGHHVFIASGRSPFMVKPILEELGIHSFISYNGQYVVFENQVIYKNPAPEEAIRRLLKQAGEGKHPVVFMAEDTMKATVADHPHVLEESATLKPIIQKPMTFSMKERNFSVAFILPG